MPNKRVAVPDIFILRHSFVFKLSFSKLFRAFEFVEYVSRV